MKAWIYCNVNERNSCSQLGELRANMRELAETIGYQISGMTSVNTSINGTDEICEACENKKMDTLILNDSLLDDIENKSIITILDSCQRNDIEVLLMSDCQEQLSQSRRVIRL